jgi:hypothetical protein
MPMVEARSNKEREEKSHAFGPEVIKRQLRIRPSACLPIGSIAASGLIVSIGRIFATQNWIGSPA